MSQNQDQSAQWTMEVVDHETNEVMYTFTTGDPWTDTNAYADSIGASVHDDIVANALPTRRDGRTLYSGIGFWDGTGADVYAERA